MNKRSLPTLEDVAKRAGVSTATVSRCLNEPDKLTKATKDRVMEAVQALHYAPNFGARAIAANRTGIFAAIIPTMENAIFARAIEAFQEKLVANGATMLVASSGYDREQEERLLRTMVGRGADGVLLIGADRDPSIYEFLIARNIPYVIAWARPKDPSHSYVGFDNREASKNLTSHALAFGHKKLAYISAKTTFNDRARERVAGAKEAIHAYGLFVDEELFMETEYSVDHGRQAFEKIWNTGQRPTLIICGNDVLGVGAIQGAQAAGLSIPKDISIIGFDDIEMAKIISPALTTMHVPQREMGRKSAQVLLDLVDGGSKPIHRLLETKIVERQSLGQLPA